MEYSTLLEKLYAGFLGMNIGIRIGAPVEPSFWTYERIRNVYGDITGYIKPFSHFAADDDVNGPVYFLRALDDNGGKELKADDVAEAWLNYTREGVGFFWWGGYGISTEHTAYLNLKNGMKAPHSGSIEQNGLVLAEQIGGQIFIDTWGLVAAGDPERAAHYAKLAASVSHDGEGLNGAIFFAACVAEAFINDDYRAVIEKGLSLIPEDSLYYKVFRAVEAFHASHPDDWRACRQMLTDEWGYDKYIGACHIVPNAGVCALSFYYGKGDFARSLEIATMCGWDTDCNASNIGTVLGVLHGLAGIPEAYRAPLNDEIILSGISGYLNILDVPSYTYELAAWYYRLLKKQLPKALRASLHPGEIYYNFELPGSVHGFRVSDPMHALLRHHKTESALEVVLDRMKRGDQLKLYMKPMWRRADFDDERYMPVFSPRAYCGNTVEVEYSFEKWKGETLLLTPYVRASFSGKNHLLQGKVNYGKGDVVRLSFEIPEIDGDIIDEIGFLIDANTPPKNMIEGSLMIRSFRVYGRSHLKLDPARMKTEFASPVPFSINHGGWSLEHGRLHALSEFHAEAMTGNYYLRDVTVTAEITPENGGSHLLGVRVQGARRGYYAGLSEKGKAAIFRHNDGKLRKLAEVNFPWQYGRQYKLSFTAEKDLLTLLINGEKITTANDKKLTYGMVSAAIYGNGRFYLDSFEFEGQI